MRAQHGSAGRLCGTRVQAGTLTGRAERRLVPFPAAPLVWKSSCRVAKTLRGSPKQTVHAVAMSTPSVRCASRLTSAKRYNLILWCSSRSLARRNDDRRCVQRVSGRQVIGPLRGLRGLVPCPGPAPSKYLATPSFPGGCADTGGTEEGGLAASTSDGAASPVSTTVGRDADARPAVPLSNLVSRATTSDCAGCASLRRNQPTSFDE
jgi:hypothetical protein